MTLKLNKDQTILIEKLLEFYDSDEKYFLLSGQAGVGKTTSMIEFITQITKIHDFAGRRGKLKICMSAPTNKATQVLRKTLRNKTLHYKTIYSVLGLRMMADGGVKVLKDSEEDRVSNFKLLILDEGSMISHELLEYMESKIALADTKVVIIGDREQLPPVGELNSPIWKKYKVNYELTEVMRHQNAILTFVQSIRGNNKPSFFSPGLPVVIDDDKSYMEKIEKHARLGDFHSGNARAIAWRNMTVEFMNKFIRSKFELTNSVEQYCIGDRIVFREPMSNGDIPVATTDQEGVVTEVKITNHNVHRMLNVWKLNLILDDRTTCVATVVHEDSLELFQKLLEGYTNKKPKPDWFNFWKLKESFQNITHAYAITAHRSQGSTFANIFVDAGDIMLNKNIEERTKCLYVACSRASGTLNIYP